MLRFYLSRVKGLLKITAPCTILTSLYFDRAISKKGLIDPSACWVQKEANIPSPRRMRSVKRPTQGPAKTIKSSPHALAPQPT